MKIPTLPAILLASCASVLAQVSDAPPVDVNQLLQGLRQFKEQNETSVKTRQGSAYQQVIAAASSNEKAAAFWTECVLAVQFAGVDQQAQAMRDWKQGEGEGLRSKEGANAARLHLYWLGLTIQHAAGVETAKLLGNIIDFTKQLETDELMIGKVEEQIDKAKEHSGNMKKAAVNKSVADETHAKKTHDNIMRMSVLNSPVSRKLQIADLLSDLGGKRKKADAGEGSGWESVPGNLNGIYNGVILPEFRANKDPRLLEYWDGAIRKAQQRIDPGMADYDERQWTQVRLPRMQWSRAQDVMVIGQRNRAVTEMFNLIKAYPQHPDAAGWISALESMLSPSPAAPPVSASTVPPGAAIPSVTAPAPVPTATLVPPPAAPLPR